jgi:hypothetical protein
MTERWRRSLRQLDAEEPSPDVWDRAVARSVQGPLRDIRMDRRRRIVAGAVALFVAAAGVAVAFIAFRALGTSPAAGGVVTYRDPTDSWEITYPERFRRGSVPRLSPHPRVTSEGIWMANFDPPSPAAGLRGPLWFDLPRDGVAVFFHQTLGGPLRLPRDERDSTFPISVEDLRTPPGVLSSDTLRVGNVVANGETYTVSVRLGPQASQQDQEAVADIVSSLRFLPLEEGTAIGRQTTFYVLGPPDRYAEGSVTRFDASSLPRSETADPFPFYLVRVPRGFYALAWPADLVGGYQDCGVTYDPSAQEFTCPNGARWALDGSVIAKPDPDMPNDPLRVLLVRISLDDHVLVSPNVFMSDPGIDLKVTGQ